MQKGSCPASASRTPRKSRVRGGQTYGSLYLAERIEPDSGTSLLLHPADRTAPCQPSPRRVVARVLLEVDRVEVVGVRRRKDEVKHGFRARRRWRR